MATKARSPALTLVLGNPGKRRVKKRARQADAGAPRAPRWLPPEAKRKYRQLRPPLVRRGLLTPLDADALVAYAVMWSVFKETVETLANRDRDYSDVEGTLRADPAFAQMMAALKMMRVWGSLLGLDPVSRDRMGMGGPEEKDALSEFLE